MNTLSFLAQEAPGFALRGSQVRVIRDPPAFYEELLRGVSCAQKRVSLCALYLGTGSKEEKLVAALAKNAEGNAGLRVKVLLDHCRGNRVGRDGKSSCTVLRPLLAGKAQDRCNVSLYHTPALRGLRRRLCPPKLNETVGLQHCKVFVFDDDVLVSGANLSDDYFSQRQDRYVLFRDCPGLADYFDQLIETVSGFSFRLQQDGDFSFPADHDASPVRLHPYEGNYSKFVSWARGSMERFLSDQRSTHALQYSDAAEGFVDPSRGQGNAADTLDTWVFPTVQMGLFGADQDSRVTTKLLRSCGGDASAALKLGTGYFNPTRKFLDTLLTETRAKVDILMAHPTANGFYGARFPLGGIPHGYTLIAGQFLRSALASGQAGRVDMHEYSREGWTFHGKGLWYYPPSSDSGLPMATLVGSPNFGHRSEARDLESQVAVVTRCQTLRKVLHEEQRELFVRSEPVTEEELARPDRRVPFWCRAVVALFRNFF